MDLAHDGNPGFPVPIEAAIVGPERATVRRVGFAQAEMYREDRRAQNGMLYGQRLFSG
jgi:hypothetical protein